METIYDKILRIVGDTSWSASVEDKSYVEFSTYTTFGNDFSFAIILMWIMKHISGLVMMVTERMVRRIISKILYQIWKMQEIR